MHRVVMVLLCLCVSAPSWARKVDLDYHVRLLPGSGQAEVRVTLADGSAVRGLDFNLGQRGAYSDFASDGQWTLGPQGQRGLWAPAAGKSSLTYRVRLTQQAANGDYESRLTSHWALFRGEQLVPPARLDQQDGVELVARLSVELPKGWTGIETAWPRIGKQRFRIDDVSRRFDRPTGWMLAGSLGSRRARLGETDVTIAAPRGQGLRRLDTLTLMTFVWPQLQAVFPRPLPKLLVVGAHDPMRRMAVAAPRSLYLDSGRALINENGSSPLLRGLVEAFAQIRDRERSDWLGESLVDYYATAVLQRAGGLSDDRYRVLQRRLHAEAEGVTTLRGDQATPAQVARGVLLLQALDKEIRVYSHDKRSLDDVTRALMRLPSVSTEEFVQLSEQVLGRGSSVLEAPVLH
ncbi:hypothetical protein G7007_16125 [Pseudomonas entomophila]|uniref:hypothetical protein n=1 Tax=Pseudomonas entomophila TaxID=312306 RepID=UPI0015E29A54|nr:hypothetical protein [Pseudomonas entomophila]MBA1194365.1 hypothetical protein [Pseudomonas entomophila]